MLGQISFPSHFLFNAFVYTSDETCRLAKVSELFVYQNLSRVPAENVEAGDICTVCGINDIMIGETIADKSSGKAVVPTIKVEEPTVKMSFSINISSFVGREIVQATLNKDVGYDFAVDIWSLGFTIIVLFTGKRPWSGLEVVILLDYEHKILISSEVAWFMQLQLMNSLQLQIFNEVYILKFNLQKYA
ncbi:uncharacterized protein LOC110101387 [Dendrobium catenatum]|uniref:uncharacterized protein LOC110101387 n=1 Tax=Dendrobium catenatum TaxID=906689 RepID=UPI0010A014BF|nr:uncharacterized protein LOC110101387 [Dendrobium catenatum]